MPIKDRYLCSGLYFLCPVLEPERERKILFHIVDSPPKNASMYRKNWLKAAMRAQIQ
jgi:hypothetical protein